MEKTYDHKKTEERIYQMLGKGGYFKPEIHPMGRPYCIILPPPNANGALHFGHAMYTVEDILIRYHRMKGYAALWLPGTDHAGIETQFVFEKQLAKEGKSRFDFPRDVLYEMIKKYVDENRGGIENQLRRLGYSLDWSREKYTLDPDIVELVNQTFREMYEKGLVYRDYRLVNYCTKDGTSFSDLEVVSEGKEGILYHIKYPIKEGGYITVATTRPETMFGDVAVMVNPEDRRYKEVIGKTVILPLVNREIPIIADEYVDKEFGTGAVKVTPSHDFNDFEVGRKYNLTFPPIIGWSGKFEKTGIVDGLYANQARERTIVLLKEKNLLIDEKPHKMIVKICYKCKTPLEPLPLEQWYVRVNTLKTEAIKKIKSKETQIFPKQFERILLDWLEGLRDWNISRQNVWGIRIPVWYEVENDAWFAVSYIDKDKKLHQGTLGQLLREGHTFEAILAGLQRVIALMEAKVVFEDQKLDGKRYLPETDTFDTWFSSGQWPYVTLKTEKPGDFKKFYPTSVMETAYDILRLWVSRMLMMGIFLTGETPFKHVLFHGLVNDPYGKKMSKSKGNVVNPIDLIEKYGADAVRFALIYGNATGSDQSLSYTKLEAARRFTNKLWNMGRFIETQLKESKLDINTKILTDSHGIKGDEEKRIILKTKSTTRFVSKNIKNYKFNLAAESLYEFIWHEVADKYIEYVKVSESKQQSLAVLAEVYKNCLKLLHPFMPFVTEEIYGLLTKSKKPLMIEAWP